MFSFEWLKNIYLKRPELPEEIKAEDIQILMFYLSQDLAIKRELNSLFGYLDIAPLHFYKLLWATIPKKNAPFFTKVEKIEKPVDTKWQTAIKQYFNWTSREFEYYKPILETRKQFIINSLGLEEK